MLLWFGAANALHPTPSALAVGTAIAALIATLIGIPAATIVARESGREDPGHVVIDEVAGQLIALLFLPVDWPHAILGLLLFRFFDILKPPPVRQLERLPGGTGIMMDDVAAGVLALFSAQILLHFIR
jgi:phosphatidylglycerophosphatase A